MGTRRGHLRAFLDFEFLWYFLTWNCILWKKYFWKLSWICSPVKGLLRQSFFIDVFHLVNQPYLFKFVKLNCLWLWSNCPGQPLRPYLESAPHPGFDLELEIKIEAPFLSPTATHPYVQCAFDARWFRVINGPRREWKGFSRMRVH